MDPTSVDIVCENCGTHLSVDLDFCPECGSERGGHAPPLPPAAPGGGHPPAPHAPHTWPQQPAPMPVGRAPIPRGRVSMGVVIGTIGLILAIIGIATISWFVVETTEGSSTMTMGLKELEVKFDDEFDTFEQRDSYSALESVFGSDMTMDDVAGSTWWVLLVGIILGGFFALLALLVLIGALRGSLTWMPVVIGVIGGILIVVAAAYFGVGFQPALEDDIDQKLSDAEDTDYGLGSSWYMTIIGGVLLLVGALMSKAPSAIPVPNQL